jgi:hypothetical protein
VCSSDLGGRDRGFGASCSRRGVTPPGRPILSPSSSYFRANPALLVLVQSQSVYLIPQRAKPVRLNFCASFAWQQLSRGLSIDEVCVEYARHFEIGRDAARTEVGEFVAAMRNAGYLAPVTDDMGDHDGPPR